MYVKSKYSHKKLKFNQSYWLYLVKSEIWDEGLFITLSVASCYDTFVDYC